MQGLLLYLCFIDSYFRPSSQVIKSIRFSLKACHSKALTWKRILFTYWSRAPFFLTYCARVGVWPHRFCEHIKAQMCFQQKDGPTSVWNCWKERMKRTQSDLVLLAACCDFLGETGGVKSLNGASVQVAPRPLHIQAVTSPFGKMRQS